MGAHPLFFEEGPRRGNPFDPSELPVPNDDPLYDDPAELLPPGRRRRRDRLGQRQDPRSIRVEGPDTVPVGQLGEIGLRRIPLGEVLGIGQVTPGVLLLQLFEPRLEPRPLSASPRDLGCFDFPRIPFTADPTDFELLAAEGAAIVRLHLLEEPGLTLPRIEGAGDLTIGEPRYEAETQRLWINGTQYLVPVSAEVWAAAIGGSAILVLWIRNHRGRRLRRDEALELARIVASLAAAESRRPDIEALVEDVLAGEMIAG